MVSRFFNWQTVNRRHPACRRLLRKHKLLFSRLFSRLVEIADDAYDNGGLPMIFEWPRHCTYWKLPEVIQFISSNELRLAHFDGCFYGLRSCIPGSEAKYLNKPSTIATNLPEVHERFDGCMCPGIGPDHVHDVTCGKNAKHSQGYTSKMVENLHYCIKRHFEGPSCWWNPSIACARAPA